MYIYIYIYICVQSNGVYMGFTLKMERQTSCDAAQRRPGTSFQVDDPSLFRRPKADHVLVLHLADR